MTNVIFICLKIAVKFYQEISPPPASSNPNIEDSNH